MNVDGLQKLTPRQKEILRLLLVGFDTKSIARELDISVHTVTEHLREARRHLGVSNSREAARILGQAEEVPPNNLGRSTIGVGDTIAAFSSVMESSARRRLVYIGATFMILLTTAALALTFSTHETHWKANDPAYESNSANPEESDPNHFPVLAIPVEEFDQLKVSGAFKVSVFVSDRASQVSLVGPRTMTADVIVSVDDGILTIRFREGAERSWNPGAGVNVSILTSGLSSVNIDGPTQIEINGPKGDSFAATTEAAGSIEVTRLDVGKVDLTTNGAGSILVGGSAREATYLTSGAGLIDAKRLRVTNAKMAVGGAGSIYADVSGDSEILLRQRRGGRVEVVGGGTCISQPANSDRIDCR
ncbi:GIN domain-containing protein [Erythrobacter sp. MTPC3]|uniref:GIN domain-containing protein n=1 Tax=Erythrobacter sp. MTPC3 TaxID=3056564 RepID=UPI0036F2B2BA